MSILELRSRLSASTRDIPNESWLESEMLAISMCDLSEYFIQLQDSGNVFNNPSNSSVAYILGITDIKPTSPPDATIDHGRSDFPDIDLDFADRHRERVKDYLKERWGQENVAGITTYGEFTDKNTLKNVASVFGVPFAEANTISSKFETLEEFGVNNDLKKFSNEWPGILEVSKKLRGRYRQAGSHAGGVVVSSLPLHKVLPIETRTEKGDDGGRVEVTAYDMSVLEDLGLIKMDILGVKAISVIADCLAKIKEVHGKDVEEESLDVDREDPAVYELINGGNVSGVFQIEGSGYTNLIKDMSINDFNDLVASNALVRPGAFITQGRSYLARREGREKVRYVHPSLEPVLEDTFGTIVYQEQLMQLVQVLAGFTKAEANDFRRIVGKKLSEEEFEPHKEKFLEGVSDKISEAEGEKLWADILKTATYQFNKSHAVGYSLLSYQTAWLKAHYPTEFMWALLNNEDDESKITTYLFDALRQGIEILPPDVNKSDYSFGLIDGKILFGIGNVMGCGPVAVDEIISKRPYSSFEEFTNKVAKSKVRKPAMEALEKVGAFISIGHDPGYDTKKYYAEILNYPIFLNEKTEYDSIITDCVDVGKDFAIIRGVVKSTSRTPRYFRAEIEDTTGVYSGFLDKGATLSKRTSVMAIVDGNSIVAFDDYRNKEGSTLFKFITDIYGKDLDTEHIESTGVATEFDLSLGDKFLGYVINVSVFTTKAGRPMATMHVYFPGSRRIEKLVVFASAFGRLVNRVSDAGNNWLVLKLGETKRDKTKTVDDAISLEEYCKLKGINEGL